MLRGHRPPLNHRAQVRRRRLARGTQRPGRDPARARWPPHAAGVVGAHAPGARPAPDQGRAPAHPQPHRRDLIRSRQRSRLARQPPPRHEAGAAEPACGTLAAEGPALVPQHHRRLGRRPRLRAGHLPGRRRRHPPGRRRLRRRVAHEPLRRQRLAGLTGLRRRLHPRGPELHLLVRGLARPRHPRRRLLRAVVLPGRCRLQDARAARRRVRR